ncbi:hypothetical protein [Pelagibaculum spongiae]|uniref:Uncharacterized protein n=1 Tax=Pelagibaculum spongiae TaxID=2080658 RepID=A0A2V1GUA9_9GAMM|nr:hypothetical protein [Pelagibaculum spongiae]PVZ69599.1 hypothetical protein DC094_09840 [Pelagibaculum spongiae]
MPNVEQRIYIPVDDLTSDVGASNLRKSLQGDPSTLPPGSQLIPIISETHGETDALYFKPDSDLVELYIVGHGRMGKRLGSAEENYGAKALVNRMMNEGLCSLLGRKFCIYLYTCSSGVHIPRFSLGYSHADIIKIGTRSPYAERVAQALYKKGFHDGMVVGYGGFYNAKTAQYDDHVFMDKRKQEQAAHSDAIDVSVPYRITKQGVEPMTSDHYENKISWFERAFFTKKTHRFHAPRRKRAA